MKPNFYDDEFQQWAFGKSPDEKEYFTTNMQALHEWNKRHGYKLKLDEDTNPHDDFPIMWDLWEQEKAMHEMVQLNQEMGLYSAELNANSAKCTKKTDISLN